MKTSESINEIAPALAATQATVKDATKDRKGYGYKYADLAAVLQIVRPALTANGVCVLQDTYTTTDGQVAVATRLIHASGQWIESEPLIMPVEAKKGLSQAQCAGSVVTYARRYSLAALVGLSQEDDDAAKDDSKDDKRDAAIITPEQYHELLDLCDAAGRKPEDIAKAMGIASLGDLPAARFAKVRDRLAGLKEAA